MLTYEHGENLIAQIYCRSSMQPKYLSPIHDLIYFKRITFGSSFANHTSYE